MIRDDDPPSSIEDIMAVLQAERLREDPSKTTEGRELLRIYELLAGSRRVPEPPKEPEPEPPTPEWAVGLADELRAARERRDELGRRQREGGKR